MRAFTVNSKDLFDKKKNPGLKLSVKSIMNNKKIPKRMLDDLGYTQEDIDAMIEPPYAFNDEDKIKWNEFLRAIRDRDFTPGDSFWLNGVEFQVK